MATSHAETGTIAAKADATTDGASAETNTTTTATAPAVGVGAADVAGPPAPEAPNAGDKPADSDKKEAKSAAKKQESTKKVADAAKKLVDTALEEAGKAEKPENTQKIKILRSHPQYGYMPGETAELTANHVKTLVGGGFAEVVTESKSAE